MLAHNSRGQWSRQLLRLLTPFRKNFPIFERTSKSSNAIPLSKLKIVGIIGFTDQKVSPLDFIICWQSLLDLICIKCKSLNVTALYYTITLTCILLKLTKNNKLNILSFDLNAIIFIFVPSILSIIFCPKCDFKYFFEDGVHFFVLWQSIFPTVAILKMYFCFLRNLSALSPLLCSCVWFLI